MKTTYRKGLPERDNGFLELFEEELLDDVNAGKLVDDYVMMAQEILALLLIDNEVEHLCGEHAKHDDVYEGRYKRWGSNPGSIKIQGERLPIRVPRVRDMVTQKEVPLKRYQKLRKLPSKQQEHLSNQVFYGLTQRNYRKVVRTFINGIAPFKSSVSEEFIEQSTRELEAYERRQIGSETYVALMIDGKYMRDRQILLCVGITEEGQKRVLGFAETTTENAEAVEGLLLNLIERGLRYEKGLLVCIDGAKGLHKAVEDVFGEYAQVQRCTWHKRENVLGKVKQASKQRIKSKLNEAYKTKEYDEAKQKLETLCDTLDKEGEGLAANSLREGLEETLTLQKLGVVEELGRSFQTTNIIESINSELEANLKRIKRWVNSSQYHRWTAMSIIKSEQNFNPIAGSSHLPILQKALLERVPSMEKPPDQRQNEHKIPPMDSIESVHREEMKSLSNRIKIPNIN